MYTITNSVLMYFRKSPFIAADFFVLKSALGIMDIYISKFQIVLAVTATIIAILSLIYLAIKEISKKTDYKKVIAMLIMSLCVSVIPSDFITAAKNNVQNSNITDEAYKYGFVCCFVNSIFNSGVTEPNTYSKKNVKSILRTVKNDEKPTMTPNIIVIQLESFIDPYLISGAEYSSDPIPNFRSLKTANSSGKLNVSVFGGGTANTEFEILTGMNVRNFGIGEYPFETYLLDSPLESVCYNLKELGYATHALHNHTGTFYDRNIVYKNLGFDTFTPSEYMNGLEYNSLGWEKSGIFTDYILNTLNSTKDQDFIFTVTSQCHGKYPKTSKNKSKDRITVSGTEEILNIKNELEYYVNELYDEDKWLGEFIEEINNLSEPTMVVIYGDHMPSLDMPKKMVESDDVYHTEYVIYSNYKSQKSDKDIYTYALLPIALDTVGIHNGSMTKLNQYYVNNDINYYSQLHIIQYDIVYGDRYIYNESEDFPFDIPDMKFGIEPIKITGIELNKSIVFIKGNGFTPSSTVCANDKFINTTFIDPQTLKIKKSDLNNCRSIKVVQRTANSESLGETQTYTISNPIN